MNYVSVHDNNTLWDKLTTANPKASEEEKIRMHKLANTIVLTSQGMPLLHAGVDFLRTKYDETTGHFINDSVRHPDRVNQLDWERKAKNIDVFEYYKGMIALRKAHPAFRMSSVEDIKKNLTFLESEANTVAYVLKNNANKDEWKNILVVYNANNQAKEVTVPKANWNVVVKDGKAGVETLATVKGDQVTVSPVSALIMYTNDTIAVKDLFAGKKVITAQVESNKLKVNEKEIEASEKLVQKGEVIYLPAKDIAEAMGVAVTYDAKTNSVVFKKGNTKATVSLANFTVKANDKAVVISGKLFTTNGRLMVPASFVEKVLGGKVLADYRRYNADSTRADDTKPDIFVLYQ